jgi:hypothetical protein
MSKDPILFQLTLEDARRYLGHRGIYAQELEPAEIERLRALLEEQLPDLNTPLWTAIMNFAAEREAQGFTPDPRLHDC